MKLEQLIALKKGDRFRYQNFPALVVDRRYDAKENTGSLFDSPACLIIHFEVTRDNGETFKIIFCSIFPDPKNLTLKNYEK